MPLSTQLWITSITFLMQLVVNNVKSSKKKNYGKNF
jgi:hypothetical protein